MNINIFYPDKYTKNVKRHPEIYQKCEKRHPECTKNVQKDTQQYTKNVKGHPVSRHVCYRDSETPHPRHEHLIEIAHKSATHYVMSFSI